MDVSDVAMQNPSCPKDFQCSQRQGDATKYCKSKGNTEGSGEFKECMKGALVSLHPQPCSEKAADFNTTTRQKDICGETVPMELDIEEL